MRIHIRLVVILFFVISSSAMIFHGCWTSKSTVAQRPPASVTIDHANWMRDHLELLGSRTLRQLVLPASHDAAMYLTSFPKSLARTQNLSIHGQLSAGVRWFDLRPRFRDGSIAMFHGPVTGPTLADVLADVRRFMSEGHRELVILKFSHYDRFSAGSYAEFTRQLGRELTSWLFTSTPRGKRLADITLTEYLHGTGTVLVLCDGHFPLDKPTPGIWVYRDWDSTDPEQGDLCVYDQYSNTMSYAAMKADQLQKFASFDGACQRHQNVACDLFLLSWTLTSPTDVPAFAAEPNQNLADDMKNLRIPNAAGRTVNLLYADCVDQKLTDIAIEMNERLAKPR